MDYRNTHFAANGHSQRGFARRGDYGGGGDVYRGSESYGREEYDRPRMGEIYAHRAEVHDTDGEPIRAYFRDMAERRMPVPPEIEDVIIDVVSDRMHEVLTSHSYDHDDRAHKRFKEVLEELRNTDTKDLARKIDEHFRDLRPDERKLLSVLAQQRSKKQIADAAGLPSVARMHEMERDLASKLYK